MPWQRRALAEQYSNPTLQYQDRLLCTPVTLAPKGAETNMPLGFADLQPCRKKIASSRFRGQPHLKKYAKNYIVGYLILHLSSVYVYNQIHTYSLYDTRNYSGDQPKRESSSNMNNGVITIMGICSEAGHLS